MCLGSRRKEVVGPIPWDSGPSHFPVAPSSFTFSHLGSCSFFLNCLVHLTHDTPPRTINPVLSPGLGITGQIGKGFSGSGGLTLRPMGSDPLSLWQNAASVMGWSQEMIHRVLGSVSQRAQTSVPGVPGARSWAACLVRVIGHFPQQRPPKELGLSPNSSGPRISS